MKIQVSVSAIIAAALAAALSFSTAAPAASAVGGVGDGANNSSLAALGKLIFFDPALSASGQMSCATCHSPTHAYGPPNGLAAQFGGPDLRHQGGRAVPSLRYVLNRTPFWSHAVAASRAERLTETDNAPSGGLGWDGRFNHLSEQARFPLFNANEMANKDVASVVAKLARAPYAKQFRQAFGQQIFAYPDKAFAQAMLAIERFELDDDPSLHPYTSKFDYYLDGKVSLSARELRGKKLFDDPERGNCASCHIDQSGANGAHPLFTDYNFEALGVPRNPELKANADSHYADLGLCGPLRTDQANNKAYCGLFKTPTLRNAASRQVFFHNGRFHTLKDVLRFYVQRDADPGKWYPVGRHGSIDKFNDLPLAMRANVDTLHKPMTAKLGERPVWTEQDIDDVAAFIATLDDDYQLGKK